MVIERLHYPELSRKKASNYINSLYHQRNHPDKVDFIDDPNAIVISTINDNGDIIICCYGIPSNIDGINGLGFKMCGLIGWEKCFTKTNDADFALYCVVTDAQKSYDYVWFESEGDELEVSDVLKEFVNIGGGKIFIKYKNDRINWLPCDY